MTEIVSVADVVKELGIPALIIVVLLCVLWKAVPAMIKARQDAAAKQQEYYAQRQKQYDEQMSEVIRIAERSAQAIAASNTIIENNTEAIKQNTAIHDKVIEALTRDYEETQSIQSSLSLHDGRAEKIHHDVSRLLERGGAI